MMSFQDRAWGAVPSGYMRVSDNGGRRLVIREDQMSAITPRTCRESFERGPASRFRGRGELKSLALPGGESALIRAYRHGGMIKFLTEDLFFTWPPRPFRELAVTEELRRHGVPTLEVYGAAIEPVWGPFYRGWLITRELPDAKDLWAVFQTGLVNSLGVENCLRAAAQSVRALHRAGVFHADLNLKNILLRPEGGGIRGYIIDLDKAKLYREGLPRWRARRNLNRLMRSLLKLDPARTVIAPVDWVRFLKYYHDDERLSA